MRAKLTNLSLMKYAMYCGKIMQFCAHGRITADIEYNSLNIFFLVRYYAYDYWFKLCDISIEKNAYNVTVCRLEQTNVVKLVAK